MVKKILILVLAAVAGVFTFVDCSKEDRDNEVKNEIIKSSLQPIDDNTTYLTIRFGTWRECHPGWGICHPRYWDFYSNEFEENHTVFSSFNRIPNTENVLEMTIYYQHADVIDLGIIENGLNDNPSIPITDNLVIDNESVLQSLGLSDTVYIPEGYYQITETFEEDSAFVITVPFYYLTNEQ